METPVKETRTLKLVRKALKSDPSETYEPIGARTGVSKQRVHQLAVILGMTHGPRPNYGQRTESGETSRDVADRLNISVNAAYDRILSGRGLDHVDPMPPALLAPESPRNLAFAGEPYRDD